MRFIRRVFCFTHYICYFNNLHGGILVTQAVASIKDGKRILFRFDRAAFSFKFLPFKVPYPVPFRLLGDEAKGWLDTTYLSQSGNVRISRGNKVNYTTFYLPSHNALQCTHQHMKSQTLLMTFHLLMIKVSQFQCYSAGDDICAAKGNRTQTKTPLSYFKGWRSERGLSYFLSAFLIFLAGTINGLQHTRSKDQNP